MMDVGFSMMCLWFRLRDLLSPPGRVLDEAGVKPGLHVLDYGCGPGSYTVAAAELVGQSGKVYAADINPLALRRVQQVASRKGLRNIETIQTGCATGLESSAIDIAILYDTFHDLEDSQGVLTELHRVLKPGCLLSFSDHHMEEGEILGGVAGGGRFRLSRRGRKTYSFSKVNYACSGEA